MLEEKMEATRCLYDEKPYETEFESKVLDCKQTESGFAVMLRETMFFPEQGGQTPDQGLMIDETGRELQVLDVQIKDGIITHYLSEKVEVGSQVRGQVDFAYRFSNMQQHTGEHILSGLIHQRFGYDNVGFHLSDSIVTMDFNGVITPEELAELEMAANEVIYQNLPVEVTFPTKEEEQELNYRSKKELEGQIRIVTIPGVDVCACCAPHVKRTGEIGMLKVMSLQNYKGGVRISILCGKRALLAFREKDNVVAKTMRVLSASMEDVPLRAGQILQEKQNLEYQLGQLKQKQLLALLESQNRELEGHEGEADAILLAFVDEIDAKDMRSVINQFLRKFQKTIGVFAGKEESGYHYIIGSNVADCRILATSLRERFGAKGGGNAQMVQGSVCAKEAEIKEVIFK